MPAFVLYPGRIENGMRRILLRIHFLSTSEKTRIFGASRATRQGHFKTSSTGDENAPTVYTVSREHETRNTKATRKSRDRSLHIHVSELLESCQRDQNMHS